MRNNDLQKLKKVEQHLQKMVNCNNLQPNYPEQQFARKSNWQNLTKISKTLICKKSVSGQQFASGKFTD